MIDVAVFILTALVVGQICIWVAIYIAIATIYKLYSLLSPKSKLDGKK